MILLGMAWTGIEYGYHDGDDDLVVNDSCRVSV